MTPPPHEGELQELRRRLDEAEETLRAIRSGEVDALVVNATGGERVYTLQGADHAYRVLIEAMQQGAVSISGEGTILYCNRCFADLVKTSHEKTIGAAVADFLPPSHRTSFATLLEQGRLHRSQGELELQAHDGSLLPVLVALAPLPLGGAVTLCMVVTDLTQQKQHQDLKEESRRKDELLAMLAHELRNPLAPISNALHILQTQGAAAKPGEREMWQIIERQVEHLVRLVDDLLDVSRLNEGKINLRKQPVDIATIVSRAVESSRPLIDARGHQLQVALAGEPLLVSADIIRMAQVLLNLLTNAAKYTPEGGRIWLNVEKGPSAVVVRVRDNGMGIPPSMLAKVFELFTQAERTLARSEGGLGVGLTLARRLTEMHGGTVQAFSAGPGQGSEFVVRLPLLLLPVAPEGSPTKGTLTTPQVKTAAPSRILVVDDNRDSAESLALLLRLTGNEARTAHDGAECLALAASYRPRLVLLDIGLPDMDGYEVARRLRGESWSGKTALVALTGYGGAEDRRRAQEAGFDHHMVKPVDFGALERLLAVLEPIDGS